MSRHDLLARLLARLKGQLARGDRWLVFVGDFMDRCRPDQGNPRKLLQEVRAHDRAAPDAGGRPGR